MSISNQKILIVGGGSGMGLALARRCVEAGAKVIIAGRGEDRLQQAREALGNPAGLQMAVADITREEQVAALFHADWWGRTHRQHRGRHRRRLPAVAGA
jgi:short-subunit dehydrogenase involved in D-alanine esterification of teichoic acids